MPSFALVSLGYPKVREKKVAPIIEGTEYADSHYDHVELIIEIETREKIQHRFEVSSNSSSGEVFDA